MSRIGNVISDSVSRCSRGVCCVNKSVDLHLFSKPDVEAPRRDHFESRSRFLPSKHSASTLTSIYDWRNLSKHWMPTIRLNAFLPALDLALRPRRACTCNSGPLATMLRRAVSTQSNLAGSKPSSGQQPLRLNPTAVNAPRAAESSNKRKFERTMSTNSTLGALHGNVYFNENDFDDDLVIDLTGTPPSSGLPPVQYPQLNRTASEVIYPTLPTDAKEQPLAAPPSSAPIPWSSSPPEPPRPSKRRTVPWLDKDNKPKGETFTKPKKETFTPLPKDKPTEKYPWNRTASALRDEQKALRQRNKDRQQKKIDLSKQTSNGKRVPETFLSEEQRQIVEVVNQGKSVFFTGSAGTGKSVLMRAIIAKLRDIYHKEPDRIAVTASTGLAACNIEGITLHSFAGIGLGKEAAPELIKKIRKNQKNKQRWMRTKVLIIDEVSMVDGDLFDKLEQIARSLRNNGRPFGGIQLVVTGDFFQLPPVPDNNKVAKFAFDAATWNTSIEHTILLTHVFRQKDPTFAAMLNEMRLGKLTPQSIRAFQSLNRPLQFEDDVEATELCVPSFSMFSPY